MYESGQSDAAAASARVAQSVASAADEERRRNRRVADAFEDRIDRLLLLNEAMWELLSGRLGVGTEELAAKIHEIDGRSGRVDGKREQGVARRCPGCDAAVPIGAHKCQFCGAQVGSDDPFAI